MRSTRRRYPSIPHAVRMGRSASSVDHPSRTMMCMNIIIRRERTSGRNSGGTPFKNVAVSAAAFGVGASFTRGFAAAFGG
jgi:hypothetical protein